MRKFNNAIKVRCEKCNMSYWTEYNLQACCCRCRGDIVEDMNGSDYDWKKQLESNN